MRRGRPCQKTRPVGRVLRQKGAQDIKDATQSKGVWCRSGPSRSAEGAGGRRAGGEKDAYARIAATSPSTRGIVQIDSEKSASDRTSGLGDGFPAADASASGVRSPHLNTSEEHRAAAATGGQASATPRMRGLPV